MYMDRLTGSPKNLKLPKNHMPPMGQSLDVNRKTDITMVKRKRKKDNEGQTLQWSNENGKKTTKDRHYNGQTKTEKRQTMIDKT